MEKVNFFVFSDDCDGESGRVVCAVKMMNERVLTIGVSFVNPGSVYDSVQAKIDADQQLVFVEISDNGREIKRNDHTREKITNNFVHVSDKNIDSLSGLMFATRAALFSAILGIVNAPEWAKEMDFKHWLEND